MNKRIEWIDCAKFVAVIAVVTDHCNGVLYTNPLIAYSSYFSVSLFILLSGISTWIVNERNEISFANQLERVKKILIDYAVAVLIVLCVTQRRFDLKTYLGCLANFNIQGPYYYLVFYVQLLMFAPILVNWCRYANKWKYKWIIHAGVLGFLGWFAYISINFTYILPVHGGGQYGGGGTYIILYYIGMMLFSNGVFKQHKKRRVAIASISLGVAIVWVVLMTEGRLVFDSWMTPYWGGGFNPPSINFMVYALLILFFCYSFFSLMSDASYVLERKVVKIVCYFGKNTLYIWLYHLLIKDFMVRRFPRLLDKNIGTKLIIFSVIVTLPVFIRQFILKFYAFYNEKIKSVEEN